MEDIERTEQSPIQLTFIHEFTTKRDRKREHWKLEVDLHENRVMLWHNKELFSEEGYTIFDENGEFLFEYENRVMTHITRQTDPDGVVRYIHHLATGETIETYRSMRMIQSQIALAFEIQVKSKLDATYKETAKDTVELMDQRIWDAYNQLKESDTAPYTRLIDIIDLASKKNITDIYEPDDAWYVKGKIEKCFKRTFTSKRGIPFTLADLKIDDQSGSMPVTIWWNANMDKMFGKIDRGKTIVLIAPRLEKYRGKLQLSTGRYEII